MNSSDVKKAKSVGLNSRRVSKPKTKKDPNAPKKPMTAFMLFSNDKRSEIRANNSDLKMTEVAKECGRLWREISDSAKAKYQLMADEDKKRYQQQIKVYQSDI